MAVVQVMTTWTGLRRPLVRFTPLLAAALLGAAAPAEADVTAAIVGTELRIAGDDATNGITLRLSIDTLRIELWNGLQFVDDFQRSLFTTIRVDALGGNDVVTIDEAAGNFTDTEATTILGGDGNDTING